MKVYYDAQDQPHSFKFGVLVNLRLDKVTKYQQYISISSSIASRSLPFYRTNWSPGLKPEPPDNMRVRDVNSFAHLGPATDPVRDPYQRRRPPWLAVIIGGENEYPIERVVHKRRMRHGRG